MGRFAGLAAAALLLVGPTAALSQEIGRPEAGRALAERVCAECHAVGRDRRPSPNRNAPSFQAIAEIPGMTAVALNAALQTSHETMPNVLLKEGELADIVAYILSLQPRQ
jgi:mono/diheme cytochrome c family protein